MPTAEGINQMVLQVHLVSLRCTLSDILICNSLIVSQFYHWSVLIKLKERKASVKGTHQNEVKNEVLLKSSLQYCFFAELCIAQRYNSASAALISYETGFLFSAPSIVINQFLPPSHGCPDAVAVVMTLETHWLLSAVSALHVYGNKCSNVPLRSQQSVCENGHVLMYEPTMFCR